MKTVYAIILLTLLTAAQNTQAQMWMGVYGLRSNTNGALPQDVGGGFAMNFLSKGSKFGGEKSTMPFQIQYGGNFIWSGLGRRTFNNVPLLAPQVGLSQVTLSNSFFGLNIMGRISAPNKTIFTPYVDFFGGYRGMFSNLNINPYYKSYGYKNQSDQTLASVNGLNFGFGGGVMTNLSKRVRLDVGLSYSQSFTIGRYADLSSAYADGGGINLNMKQSPNGIVMFNVGLMFYLEDDGTHNCNCHHSRSYGRVGGGWGGGWGGGGRSSNVGIHIGGGGGGIAR